MFEGDTESISKIKKQTYIEKDTDKATQVTNEMTKNWEGGK